ncbi:MAG: DEAD/DEAH box helicase [Clostridia bacterium]|nr:DEAD/DEAH box helicase [Clostridia bacterium]
MPLFSLQKIAAVAAGQQTYLRGISCYNGGCVKNVEYARGSIYHEIVTADVTDPSRAGLSYHCELCFDFDGKPAQMECSCAVFDPSAGACKHLVGVLVHKYYTDMVSGRQSAPVVTVNTAPTVTDDIAAAMIERYMEREAAVVTAQTAAPVEPIRLVPTLHLNGQSARLSISLSGSRRYVLRDLRAFAEAVTDNRTVAYGKDFSFFHHIDSFAKDDQPLLRFLIGQLPPVPRGTVGGHALRELPLSPVALDAFFAIMRDRTITCHLRGKDSLVTIRREDPVITVSVSKSDNGYFLASNDTLITLLGSRRRYVLSDDTIYCCSSAFCDSTAHLLDALQASHGRLFISDNDMPSFCAGALHAVRDRIRFDGDIALLDRHLPAALEAELYLDAPDDHTIAAKLLFCYGDRRVTAFTDDVLDGVTRDTLQEYRLRLIAQSLFNHIDERDGRLLLRGDDNALFDFLTAGIARLAAYAAVFATDRVHMIGMAPPPRIGIGVRMRSDLLDLTLDADGMDATELQAVLQSYREKRTFHRLKNGRFLALDTPSAKSLYELTEELSAMRLPFKNGTASLPMFRALYLDRVLRDNPAIHLNRDEGFRRLVRDITAVADNEFSPPASLDDVLRNYQKTGFRWLKTMQQYGFGGILADDMGLGKTLQMISLLLDAKEHGESRPSLVVCPASLIYNWQNEFTRFAPTMRVCPIAGDKATREKLLSDTADVDVFITSYELLKRDRELYTAHHFAFHILDEAQYIKNASTLSARTNKAVKSDYRFALTGTPIENRLSELWSIFDFLMPGFLYSYARFRERLETPIAQGNEAALGRLDKLVSPFILRRLKKDVLRELPPKREAIVRCSPVDEQKAIYAANVQLLRDELNQNGLTRNHITVLSMLTRLRQICCSPALCYDDYKGGSAKIDTCLELVREAIDGGHRVLLFSQFTSLLDLLAESFKKEDIPFFELRGSTPKEQRAALVDRFNNKEVPLFLISLKAGGTGLNLTAADVVIHFDPWWNLSAQNQATDRAHRIGQERTVQVYKLIAADTIEEKILQMQERKQALADAIVHEGDGLLSKMTKDDLLSLLQDS